MAHAPLSKADMDALAVLASCHAETERMVQELARAIAGERTPRRGRHRYAHIERPERGVVVADVLNTETGQMRRFRFTKNSEGEIAIEEL
jgi:hypothetical protein